MLLIILPVLFLAALALAGFASHTEETDSFCTVCHTVPEVTYDNRAQAALAIRAGGAPTKTVPDLASVHYISVTPTIRCIDCHRGNSGLIDRATTLALGSRDALIFFSGRANPAIEKNSFYAPHLLNAACDRCHTKTLLVTGFENHFHNFLPDAFDAWANGGQLTAPPTPGAEEEGGPRAGLPHLNTTVTCVDCHRAHVTAQANQMYLQINTVVLQACQRCHQEVGRGPSQLVAP